MDTSPLDIPGRRESPGLLSPESPSRYFQLPSPIVTRRTRTKSTSERALENPIEHGTVKYFSRNKGHGFISPESGNGEDIFVHISDIEGEYIPLQGDEVSFRLCLIPPKNNKLQAVNVNIVNLIPEIHQKWDSPCEEEKN